MLFVQFSSTRLSLWYVKLNKIDIHVLLFLFFKANFLSDTNVFSVEHNLTWQFLRTLWWLCYHIWTFYDHFWLSAHHYYCVLCLTPKSNFLN